MPDLPDLGHGQGSRDARRLWDAPRDTIAGFLGPMDAFVGPAKGGYRVQ